MAMSSSSSRQRMDYLRAAKTAQEEERYEDMAKSMKKLAELNVELTREERTLLRSAYKLVIERQRSEDSKNASQQLTDTCSEAISIIDNHVLPHSTEIESIVHYNMMKGDYYRYIAEMKTGDDERKETGRVALKAYKKAVDVAEVGLPVANYVRLGATLNMSVLLYAVMEWKESAIELAEDAYREAASEIDKEDSSDLSKIVLELLLENIGVWKKLRAA